MWKKWKTLLFALIMNQILCCNIVSEAMPYPLSHVSWPPTQTDCSRVTLWEDEILRLHSYVILYQ